MLNDKNEPGLPMLFLMMVLYMILLLLIASIVQLAYNNVVPYITQNSLKFPPINILHALSLLILTSTLVKTSCVCANNGRLD